MPCTHHLQECLVIQQTSEPVAVPGNFCRGGPEKDNFFQTRQFVDCLSLFLGHSLIDPSSDYHGELNHENYLFELN